MFEAWGKKSGCERGFPSHYKTTQGSMVLQEREFVKMIEVGQNSFAKV